MSPYTYEQYRFLKTVIEDLNRLATTWSMSTSDSRLRQESVLLRRLLVDGDYSRAWNLLGLPRTPIVRAPDLLSALGTVDRRYAAFAFAPSPDSISMAQEKITMNPGEAIGEGDLLLTALAQGGRHFALFVVVPSADLTFISDRESFAQSIGAQIGVPKSRHFWLEAYLDSPATIVRQEAITRREVIKYVANSLGGVHYGAAEKSRSAHVKKLLDPQYVKVDGRPAVYLELLYIGRVLAESTDVYRLSEAFRKIEAPKDPFDAPDS